MEDERRALGIAAIFITAWLVMGFDLSMHKTQFGEFIDWVGYSGKVKDDEVVVSIKRSSLDNLMALTKDLIKNTFIKISDPRCLPGVRSLIHCGQPCLADT